MRGWCVIRCMGLKIRSDINPTPSRETTYRTISTKGVKGVSSVTKTRVSTGLPNQTSTKCCRRITVEHHRAAPANTFIGTPLVSEKYRSSSPRGKANIYDLIGRMTLPSIGKKQSKREEVVTLTAMSAQKAFRRVSQLNCGALCCLGTMQPCWPLPCHILSPAGRDALMTSLASSASSFFKYRYQDESIGGYRIRVLAS